MLSVNLPSAGDRWSGALWYRSGPGTENRDVPTADRRYPVERSDCDSIYPQAPPSRRNSWNRMGKPLQVPVSLTKHTDSDGTGWTTAGVTLASLAPGDYVIEFASEGTSAMFGVRVVP